MLQRKKLTHSEKTEMYKKHKKDELISMLIVANNAIDMLTEDNKNIGIYEKSNIMKTDKKLNWAKLYKIYKEDESCSKTYLNINMICMVIAFTLLILINYYNLPLILHSIVWVLILIQCVCVYKSFKLHLKFL